MTGRVKLFSGEAAKLTPEDCVAASDVRERCPRVDRGGFLRILDRVGGRRPPEDVLPPDIPSTREEKRK